MIDPVSAIAVATTAYKTVVAMVNAGRELEDTLGALGKWYGAAADIARAEQQRKNPGIFARITFDTSPEQEALDILIYKKKLQEQEYELRTLISYRFGLGAWEELIQLRRRIRKQREETIYKQMERRRAFFEWTAVIILFGLVLGLIGGLWWLIAQAG